MIIFDWLIANIGTVSVGLVVLAVVALVIAAMVHNKKKGKSSTCGCGCESCAMAGKCHQAKPDQE